MRPVSRLVRTTLLIAIALALDPATGAWSRPPQPMRMTTASAVRVRAQASTTAAVVDTLGVGVVFNETGRSTTTQKINGIEDYWFGVTTASGKQGWVFGGLTRAVDPARLDDAYLTLGRERLELTIEDLTFSDWADLAGCMKRASAKAKDRASAAELELMYLTACSNALFATSYEQQSTQPFKSFRDGLGDLVSYNEIGANWLMKPDAYWSLRDRYADLPIAERIAWDAAHVPLGGECEGDLECDLGAFNITLGRYLQLYPKGPHADDALAELIDVVKPAVEPDPKAVEDRYTIPDDPAYRKDLAKDLVETRKFAEATAASKRGEALRLVDALAGRLK